MSLAVDSLADFRTFTAADGRTLEAQPLRLTETKVELMRKSDGRKFWVTLDSLSEDDNTYLSEWATSEGRLPPMLPARLAECLTRSEAFYRQGHYADALAEIGALPDIERCAPIVVDMEVRLCMAAGEWERGLKRAYLIEFADGDELEVTAAEFYREYAAHLAAAGDLSAAKIYIKEASRLFPPLRLGMLEDPRLERALYGDA